MNIRITKQIGGGVMGAVIMNINYGDGQTVNVRNSGSLSCRLSGASGRLVLRW